LGSIARRDNVEGLREQAGFTGFPRSGGFQAAELIKRRSGDRRSLMPSVVIPGEVEEPLLFPIDFRS
jgi:hypothetical protein